MRPSVCSRARRRDPLPARLREERARGGVGVEELAGVWTGNEAPASRMQPMLLYGEKQETTQSFDSV